MDAIATIVIVVFSYCCNCWTISMDIWIKD